MYRAVLKTQPDGKLATLAAEGSEPAFEVIVQRYRRPLLTYCQGRLRLSHNRSEDVVQQSLMNAWGSLRAGTEVHELRPWLYRITHNQAVTMMRASSSDEISISDLRIAADGGADRTASSAVEDVYEHQSRVRDTLKAVSELPELQRQALVATAVDGLSYEQVATALNTSSDAVRGLIHRARNTLRSGVAVFLPGPLVLWAANQGAQTVTSEGVQQWIGEAVGGGGTLGVGAAAAKGAAVVASSAALVGGGIGAGLTSAGRSPANRPAPKLMASAPSATTAHGTPPAAAAGRRPSMTTPSGATRALTAGGTPTAAAPRSSGTARAPAKMPTMGSRRAGEAPSPRTSPPNLRTSPPSLGTEPLSPPTAPARTGTASRDTTRSPAATGSAGTDAASGVPPARGARPTSDPARPSANPGVSGSGSPGGAPAGAPPDAA